MFKFHPSKNSKPPVASDPVANLHLFTLHKLGITSRWSKVVEDSLSRRWIWIVVGGGWWWIIYSIRFLPCNMGIRLPSNYMSELQELRFRSKIVSRFLSKNDLFSWSKPISLEYCVKFFLRFESGEQFLDVWYGWWLPNLLVDLREINFVLVLSLRWSDCRTCSVIIENFWRLPRWMPTVCKARPKYAWHNIFKTCFATWIISTSTSPQQHGNGSSY